MPYAVERNDDGSFRVVNTQTGKMHSKHTTQIMAKRQMRLLHAKEHGWKPASR